MTRPHPITLAGFEQKFREDPDPWRTFSVRDELVKRAAILRALGPRAYGRLLELGSGNGGHSLALASKALRMDACEGTGTGAALTEQALSTMPRATAHQLILPAPFPADRYDAIVISELLYYLGDQTFSAVARETARCLRPGGTLVLAHHAVQFDDAAQISAQVHQRFLSLIPRELHASYRLKARLWRVEAFRTTLN